MIAAIVDINVRNPRFGYPRIAQQLSHAFGIEINKDVVRRVLAIHYHPAAGNDGPSWLTFLGHAKDSLWSIDFQGTPHYLSSDNDPLFRYPRWKANLRILDIEEIKSIPYLPISHPFIERLIGTVRRELLDHTFFWNAADLERKFSTFQEFYNHHRIHSSLKCRTPIDFVDPPVGNPTSLQKYNWQTFCREIFQLPIVA